jgi:hypothetical protein
VVVVLDDAPMIASSSDSRLFAAGGLEDEWSFAIVDVMRWDGCCADDGGGDGDRDSFELFSNVLTENLMLRKKK